MTGAGGINTTCEPDAPFTGVGTHAADPAADALALDACDVMTIDPQADASRPTATRPGTESRRRLTKQSSAAKRSALNAPARVSRGGEFRHLCCVRGARRLALRSVWWFGV